MPNGSLGIHTLSKSVGAGSEYSTGISATGLFMIQNASISHEIVLFLARKDGYLTVLNEGSSLKFGKDEDGSVCVLVSSEVLHIKNNQSSARTIYLRGLTLR